MEKTLSKFTLFIFIIILILSFSCSTVRVVPDNKSVLRENNIEVLNNQKVNPSSLSQYLRQHPNNSFLFGWNPFAVIYNWKNGKGGGWDRFVNKIGQPPVILDTFLVKRSAVNLKNHLESIGYYNSNVDDTIITKNKKSDVYYYLSVGEVYIIENISYLIKDSLIHTIVRNNLASSPIRRGAVLSEKMLSRESERLTGIIRDKGFYNFSKNFFFFEADTTRRDGTADLFIRIDNYTRNGSPDDTVSHQQYHIRKIMVYPDYDPMMLSEDSVDLELIDMPYFSIFHRGTRTIKPQVLNKMNTLRPGELYSETKANRTYNRFVSLRYFSGVNIQFDEVEADSTEKKMVDCTIRLTPSKSQGYKIDLEASSNSNNLLGVSPAVSYYHKNLFRGGEWFNLGFMGNFQFKLDDPVRSTELGVSTGLSVPSFLLLPDTLFKTNVPRTDINIGYNYQSRPEFTRNLISLTYGYNWRSGDRFYYYINPIQLNIVRLFNMNPQFYESLMDPFLRNSYRNHFDLGSGASVYYTTDASAVPKRSFFYFRFNTDIAGNILGIFNSTLSKDSTGAGMVWNTPYAQYVRSELNIGYTHKSSPDYSLAGRFNVGVGYGYGNSSALPFEKLFYAGGANSMRAWQARSLGPGSSAIDTTFSIPNQTGDFKLEMNLEYRFKMFWNLEGAIFADVGNIWSLRSEPGREDAQFRLKDFYKSIAVNWGVGARLNLDFVVLRLDLGIVARDPYLKEWISPGRWFERDTYSFQFGVGYPF